MKYHYCLTLFNIFMQMNSLLAAKRNSLVSFVITGAHQSKTAVEKCWQFHY
jgi:hypothetical protein